MNDVHMRRPKAPPRKGTTVDEGTLSVRQTVVGVLRHRWKLITAFALLGTIAALVFSLTQQARYTSTVEFVVGGQDYSSVLTTSLDPKHTGPLTLDLPADTQARVMISSTIGDRVATALSLTPTDADALSKGARSKALTDNAYSITVDGSTSALAVLYANKYADEYFAYRQDNARAMLTELAAQDRSAADAATTQASALNPAIAKAAAAADSGDVSALRTSQQQLLAAARNQGLVADQLEATARTYTGGGSVTVPATTSNVTKSPLAVRDTVFGTLLALLVGLVVAVVAEKTSDRLYTRDDVARAVGAPVLLSLPRPRKRGWRELYQRQAELVLTSLRNDPRVAAPIGGRGDASGGSGRRIRAIRRRLGGPCVRRSRIRGSQSSAKGLGG